MWNLGWVVKYHNNCPFRRFLGKLSDKSPNKKTPILGRFFTQIREKKIFSTNIKLCQYLDGSMAPKKDVELTVWRG